METWQIVLLGYFAALGIIIYALWNRPNWKRGREKWLNNKDRGDV